MPYTLGISIEYYKYKHDAIMRIFADNRLIDEVSLDNHVKLKCINLQGVPDFKHDCGPLNLSRVMFVPEKIFTYRIDEQYLKKKLRIEIKNDNNNYTNGFMTDYSYINFHRIFLIPDCLLEESGWSRLNKFDNRFVKWHADIQYFPHDFNELLYVPNHNSSYPYENLPDKGKVIKNDSQHNLYYTKRGGSFSVQIELSKKHNITHLGKPRPGKMYLARKVERLLWAYGLLNITK